MSKILEASIIEARIKAGIAALEKEVPGRSGLVAAAEWARDQWDIELQKAFSSLEEILCAASRTNIRISERRFEEFSKSECAFISALYTSLKKGEDRPAQVFAEVEVLKWRTLSLLSYLELVKSK